MTMIDTKNETRHGNDAIETDPSWSLARRAKTQMNPQNGAWLSSSSTLGVRTF